MHNSHRFPVVVCVFALSLVVPARSRDANQQTPRSPQVQNTEAERIARERRERALSLLISLGTDAGTFTDQALRARTQARIADALWRFDKDRARSLFRKAWEAAEIADDEGQQRAEQDAREQLKSGGGYAIPSPPEIRTEVLRLAVKQDNTLGEEFLTKINEKKARDAASAQKRIVGDANDYGVSQRIRLAIEILAAGDKVRALQFADPVLGTTGIWTIDFLSTLRETDPAAADQRYLRMLSIAAANPQTDPNAVSLLSSYLFTPHNYFTVSPAGGLDFSSLGSGTVVNVAPTVRAEFFRIASEILLRAISPGESNPGSVTVITRFYVIRHLIPFFAAFAPAEVTAALRTQFDALTEMASPSQRREDETDQGTTASSEPKQTFEQSMLDKIDRARTAAERDQLYFELAVSGAGTDNLKAREYANKIEETELRNNVRAYVDASLAVFLIHKKDAEGALEIARNGELTHIQRVWTMTRAAALLTKTDRRRALQVLDDATTEARRIGSTDADRARAMLAIANAILPIDRGRAWDVVSDAVRAGNSAEDFTGEDGQLTFRILTKNSRSITQQPIPEFDVAGIFRLLAIEDYERTIELAQVFEHDAPRAHSVIAIALAVLEEKKK